MTHVAPIGSCGGLALTWRIGVELESFLTNKNNITAWCFSDPPNHPWILSYIYGPPEKLHKPAFWDSLIAVGEDFVSPWLCIGDFNFVLDQFESWEVDLWLVHLTTLSEVSLISLVWWTLVLLGTLLLGVTIGMVLIPLKKGLIRI
jgi:hypothetical protein